MSKITNSQAQTKKEQWCGQDNLNLQIGNFITLCKWFDVDEHHHPVKDYIEALKEIVWYLHPESSDYDMKLFVTIRELITDLVKLDSKIDSRKQEGGPSCR